MRLLFAGTPATAVPSLLALLAADLDVGAVLTRPDAPQGRSKRLVPSPVKLAAQEAGIPVLTPPTAKDPALIRQLQDLNLDCAAVVAYGNLLPGPLLAALPRGWVNLHFSILPAYRGAAPVQAAIAAGEQVTGATTFLLDEGMDTGPVLGVLTERVRPRDTAGELLARLAEAGPRLLVDSLRALRDGTARPQPQVGEASYAPKISPAQAQVQWRAPAVVVDRLVRAHTPAPGAWTRLAGVRIGLGPVTPLSEPLEPGRIHVLKSAVRVGTGSGSVELSTVHPAGKRAMAAADWARGAQVDGDTFDEAAQ